MREWEAEVRHRSGSLHRRADPNWQEQAHLVKRSSGALADAAFLRQQLIAHYFTVAFRHFRTHKLVTVVNVACLAMGLTCFIVAWATTAYFAQADGHQANASRLYIVIMADASSPNSPVPVVSPRVLAEHLVADFPQLDAVARAVMPREIPVSIDDRSLFASAVFADPALLEMFELPMLHAATSRTATLLETPASAIVSASFATQLFGTDRVVGRTVR
jgi:putative ABC transport system permease protein